jgi:hypothetical protein
MEAPRHWRIQKERKRLAGPILDRTGDYVIVGFHNSMHVIHTDPSRPNFRLQQGIPPVSSNKNGHSKSEKYIVHNLPIKIIVNPSVK